MSDTERPLVMHNGPDGPWRCKLPELCPDPIHGDFPCCTTAEDGHGHHLGCRNYFMGRGPRPVDELQSKMRAAAEGVIPTLRERDFDCCPHTGPAHPLYGTQEALDGLVEKVADMLDHAMHLEECWISEDETRCRCIISKLRAVLPQCGHVEQIGTKGLTRQCLSTVHPSAAHKHVFGTV